MTRSSSESEAPQFAVFKAKKVWVDERRYWDKAVETVRNLQSAWTKETPPSLHRPA